RRVPPPSSRTVATSSDHPLSLHDALPISQTLSVSGSLGTHDPTVIEQDGVFYLFNTGRGLPGKTSTDLRSWNNASAAFGSATTSDRKSTRLNSSHVKISYAVFCLKKKKKT